MTLLASGALWLLGLGGLVGAIYFLKRQAEPRYVSSLLFWRGVERQPRSALRFNRMPLLGLILQLLALIAVVLALAQPVMTTTAGSAQTLAIVLDGSASMRAEMSPDGEQRYEAAIARARDVLSNHSAANVALFQAQRNSELLVAPTTGHGTIRRVLDGFEPSYQNDADPAALLRLVESQFPNGVDRVVYVTDKPPSAQVAALGWQTDVIGSDDETANVAVTSFKARSQPNGQGVAFVLKVWNGTDTKRSLPIEIRSSEATVTERTIDVPARDTAELDVSRPDVPAGPFVAEINPGGAPDARPDDNARYATLPQQRPWRIRWVGEDSFYLSRFFERAGHAEVIRQGETATSSSPESAPDLTLAHNTTIEPSQPGRYLLVGSAMPPWIEATQGTSGGKVVIERDHPTLEGIDPSDWRLGEVPAVEVASDGEVLLSADGTPVLYLVASGGVRLAYVGVDLSQSNLGLSVDFPILLSRLMEWLAPRVDRTTTFTVGEELPLGRLEDGAQITDPDGRSCRLGQSDAACGRLDEPGIYQVTQGSTTYDFAANVPASESKLSRATDNTASTPGASRPSSTADDRAVESRRPLWPWALAIGLGLLVAELWIYDRPRWTDILGRRRQ
ncbi:MAG: VWA domain-containing protein [Candidatus Bipolaricaulia bacterium]